MKLLVCPHELIIGGSQINAIDLAAGAAAAGHKVMVYGVEGPLTDYIAERGLRWVPAHPMRYRPAPTRIAEIAALAAREQIDLIHAYEWPPCLDAYYGAGLLRGVPILCTLLSMAVAPYVPASVPLVMGTEALAAEARRHHSGPVWCLEPPIDAARDHPRVDGSAFRRQVGVEEGEMLVVSVSRLALDLKLDALVCAIDAAALLAGRHRLKLVLVGEGEAGEALRARAAAVNARFGREVVSLPGPAMDPRPAYAAADVVIGMGSSALRAMSMGRPVVVQGEKGFSETFAPETAELFRWQGFYGVGDGVGGAERLAARIDALILDPNERARLGRFGRQTVSERFSLARAIGLQLEMYEKVLKAPWRPRRSEAWRSAWLALELELRSHDPRRKSARRADSAALLGAARSGAWPVARNQGFQ